MTDQEVCDNCPTPNDANCRNCPKYEDQKGPDVGIPKGKSIVPGELVIFGGE